MKSLHPATCMLWVLISLAAPFSFSLWAAADPSSSAAPAALDRFLEAISADASYTAEARQKAAEVVSILRKDPATMPFAISEALRELEPDFKAATDRLAEEKLADAAELFAKLATSPKPHLACEANFYRGRCLVLCERYEEAAASLTAVSEAPADHTLLQGEAWFLRGVCEIGRLDRKAALAAFERFLKDFPAAPDRMKITAVQQVEQLRNISDGSLSDVWLHMNFIRRRLLLEDAGKQTRQKQADVVAMLDKLIKAAEERESESQSSSQKQSNKQAKGQGKSTRSAGGKGGGPDGQKNEETGKNDLTPYPSMGRRQYKGEVSSWSTLREKEREKVFSALEGKYPARYKQLIEQYFENVQNNEDK